MLASAPHVISTQEVPSALTLSPRCPFWCLEQPQEPREGHQRHGRVGAERDGARGDGGGGGRRCGAHHQGHPAKLRECLHRLEAGGVTGACESSESDLCRHLGLSQGGKCQQQTFPGRFCTQVSGLPAFVLPVGGSLPQTLSNAWSCLGWSLPHGSR